MTRYAPGYTGPKLPAAPSRPRVKPTVTGAPAVIPTPLPAPGTGGRPPVMQGIGNAVSGAVRNAVANQAAAKVGAMPGKRFMKKGGKVSSASKRADGCAIKGKTKGKMI